MNFFVEQILRWAIPAICAGILAYEEKIRKDNKALKSGLLAIIRSQIVNKCENYQSHGFLPEYARYCLEDLYKQYKVLGGNHGIEILVNNTYNLPTVKK